MKKVLLVSLIGLSSSVFSQAKFGLRFAPNLALSQVLDKKSDDLSNLSNNGLGVRFSAGPILDFHFTDNVAFSTGLWYTTKRVGFQRTWPVITTTKIDGVDVPSTTIMSGKSVYNLQYIQLPVSLKLYTNEITDKLKLYFILGGTLDISIAQKAVGEDNAKLMEEAKKDGKKLFSFFDAGALLGTGIEFQVADKTALFAGFSYNRGLTNILNPTLQLKNSYVNTSGKIGASLFSLDMGVKF